MKSQLLLCRLSLFLMLLAICTEREAKGGTIYATGQNWPPAGSIMAGGTIIPPAFENYGDINGLAVDPHGFLYASYSSGVIVQFTPSSHSVFASGIGGGGSSGMTFDTSGNLYTVGGPGIYKVTPSRSVSIFATDTGGGNGIGFDHNGNLYASTGNTINKITPNGDVSLYASLSQFPDLVNFGNPVFDTQGNLFVRGLRWYPGSDYTLLCKLTLDGVASELAFNQGGFSYFNYTLLIDEFDNLYFAAGSRSFSELTKVMPDGTSVVGGLSVLHPDALVYSPFDYVPLHTVPEPATVDIFAGGLMLLIFRSLGRRKSIL